MPIVKVVNATNRSPIALSTDLPRIPVAGDFIAAPTKLFRVTYVIFHDKPGPNDLVEVGVVLTDLQSLPST